MESPISSMTGYGSSAATLKGWQIRVVCRSVNHRRLKLRVFTPDALQWMEPKVTSRLRDVVSRGSVDVTIEMQPGGEDTRVEFDLIDEERFSAVVRELKRLAVDHRLVAPICLEAVWEYRPYFERSTQELFSDEDADAVMPIVDQALQAMVESRRQEGQGLYRDLEAHRKQLVSALDDVEVLRQQDQTARRSSAKEKLCDALDEFDVGDIDEGRLAQEVAYYVEKGDISEEVQRARAHLERLDEVMAQAEEAVGKKIDFYLQELIRETNTMGSKSGHPGLTDLVIEMKSLVEKMREQAANVE